MNNSFEENRTKDFFRDLVNFFENQEYQKIFLKLNNKKSAFNFLMGLKLQNKEGMILAYNIGKIYDPKIIDLNMHCNNKTEVINHLSKLLQKAGYIDDIENYINDIFYREYQGITGIGDNIAIPHGKSSSVQKVGLVIGQNEFMIPWESYYNKPVNIIFLFAVPNIKKENEIHLYLLSEIAKKIGNEDILNKIKTANNKLELQNALFS